MADVQPDQFTRLANELLEQIPKYKFNGTQFRIIITVWRYTYGFQRKQHEMSLSFFEKATGVDKSQIKKQLNKLIESKVILVIQKATFDKSRILSFNKDYEQWTIKPQVIEKTQGSNTTTPQGSKSTTPQGSNTTPKKESIKENSKEMYSREIFDYYISKNIIQHKNFDSDMKKAVKKAITKFGVDEVKTAIDNYAVVIKSDYYWFTQKYTLIQMMRDKDIRQFGSEADPLNNFLKDKSKVVQSSGPKGKTPEQIEHEKMIAEMRGET